MLTRLTIRNFKKLSDADIPLGQTVVFIGPNNSGKTTALQAMALWDVGLRAWNAKRGTQKSSPEKRPGVAINRRDLISTPVPVANLLWHGLHVRRRKEAGQERGTQNIRIDVTVSGITEGKEWKCGLEFDFSNEESIICRPLRLQEFQNSPVTHAKFTEIPPEATKTQFAFLPPMSGLTAEEPLLQPGRINVLIGQGQTAQVLRNLCYRIVENDRDKDGKDWDDITKMIVDLFGVHLLKPEFLQDRGEITLRYEENSCKLDISASGRGLQQTLLLLAHLHANPDSVLLLDEPDAHLEILRQRETFSIINKVAESLNSQIIAASHSEIVLNHAASTGNVVAFIGRPHLLNDRSSQLMKSLTSIGWDQYYQAEQTGWVLYLEGQSDLENLRSFAEILQHKEAIKALDRPFVFFVESNQPKKAENHFYGLQEAKPDLIGIALFDHLERDLPQSDKLIQIQWKRREIENYFCTRDVLLAFAVSDLPDDLFGQAESDKRKQAMVEAIEEIEKALDALGRPGPWSETIKASDCSTSTTFSLRVDSAFLLPKAVRCLIQLLPKSGGNPWTVESAKRRRRSCWRH